MGRIIIFISLVVLVAVSCSKYHEDIDNLNGGKIRKMGHAGMGIGNTYPMNSRESLIQCISYAMDGSEMDVQLTKDDVLVAFHDETMDKLTDFSGKINDYTWEELKNARFNVSPHLRFEIFRLSDLFAMEETQGKWFSFDIKLYPSANDPDYLSDFETQLLDLISDYHLDERCMVESSNVDFLNAINLANPVPELYYYPGTTFEEGMSVVLAHHFDGLTISYEELSKEKVKQAHNAGVKIATWNTHTKKTNKLAVSYHPDVIETDEVKFLSRYLP